MSEDESATQHACGLGYLMPVSEDESACMRTRVSVGVYDAGVRDESACMWTRVSVGVYESACMWTRVSVGACDAAWPVRKSGVGKILYCFSPGAIRLVVDYGEVSAEVW